MPAIMLAAPASPAGSAQAPVLTVRSAVTSGRSDERATMTRRPLAERLLRRLRQDRLHRRGDRRRFLALGLGGQGEHRAGVGRHHLRRRRLGRHRLALGPLGFGPVADGHPQVFRHVLLRHPLDVGGGDRLQAAEFAVDGVGVAVDAQRLADGAGAALDGLAFAQGGGDQLVLGLGELGGGRRGVAQALHLGQQGGLALGHGVAVGHDRADHHQARIVRQVGLEKACTEICLS
jgi:hypothetical protein